MLGVVGTCCVVHANEHNTCQHCWHKVVILALITALFCPKLFLYLFIGPFTFFPQMIVFIWHVPEARVFLEKVNQLFHLVVWPSFGAFNCVFWFSCPNVWCFLKLFAQLSLIRPVYNNPERRKRAMIVFWKNYYKVRAQTLSRGQYWTTLLWFHANGCNIVAVHFAGHRTIELETLGLVGPKVWPVSNCMQQVPTLLWFHANGCNKSQHCWAQQCWVLLANDTWALNGMCTFFFANISGWKFLSSFGHFWAERFSQVGGAWCAHAPPKSQNVHLMGL